MSEILKQRIWIMINNTIRIICFAALAAYFNKWWIVLFAGLFVILEKNK